jgi:DNA-binding MarR family transcriptional regulator
VDSWRLPGRCGIGYKNGEKGQSEGNTPPPYYTPSLAGLGVPRNREVTRAITMINPAIQASQARGLTFSLLKELAFRHHPKYRYAFPRLQTLANVLRVSIRTVQRHIRKLEDLGELRVIRGRGRGRNSRYFLTALENMTASHHSNHTREKKGIYAPSVPGAADPPQTFSLLAEPTAEVLARWLTRGSRLWRVIAGET